MSENHGQDQNPDEIESTKRLAADEAIAQIAIEEKSWRLQPAPAREKEADPEEFQASFKARSKSDLTDVQLRRRASPLVDAFQGRLPLPNELNDINTHFGLEIAQTVFIEAVERSQIYGPLVRRVRAFDARRLASAGEVASQFEVTIVASALPEAEWAAFTDQWSAWARALGFKTVIIQTREENDLRENARMISTYLLSNPHPRRILVTAGQGAAEFRSLLTQRLGVRGHSAPTLEEAFELGSIHTWINVTGAFGGSAQARRMNESRWQSFVTEAAKYFGGRDRRAKARRWLQLDSRLPAFRALPNFPLDMQVINVVGLALSAEIPLKLAVSHLELSRTIGPNDGLVGVYEAIAHPGLIVPVAGLAATGTGVRLEPVFKRLLAIVAEDASMVREIPLRPAPPDELDFT